MRDRVVVGVLAALALASLLFTPWGALSRETGARSALLLLPNRVIDFTGRTEPLVIVGQELTLALSVTALLMVLVGTLWGRYRAWLWLGGAAILFVANQYGLAGLREAVAVAQAEALEAGVNPRRLPYSRSGMGFSAFFCLAFSLLLVPLALRQFGGIRERVDGLFKGAAVPATAIFLALLVSAVVILVLQPTARGANVVIDSLFVAFVGRVDTVFYAYQTLFSGSLSSVAGFAEALKFTTPLIFTGLAVAFGFRAGLFNIGAPGQMVLGGIFAMLVGVYLPGPRLLVLPLAIFAAMLGGALWGAIPGWLKARFGANEVINTILLNYIAASLLLFLLSADQTFATPALRIIYVIAAFAGVALLLSLLRPVRDFVARSPRLVLAAVGVLLLVAVVFAGVPRAGDGSINLNLPFKAPGLEPKSHPIRVEARVPQLPALFGIDIRATPGTNVVPVNAALPLALIIAAVAYWLLPRFIRRRLALAARAGLALAVGAAAYLLLLAAGVAATPVAIPPSNLNASFFLALLAALVVYLLLWRTKWGYELRAAGLSPKAAEYAGANVAKNIILAMTISGALAGLTASHYVLGGALEEYALRQGLPTGDGFEGIAVALLGGNTPVGVVLSAFLFGVMKNGGSTLNITFSDLTRDVVNMILALVVLFIAARGFLPDRARRPKLPPSLVKPVSDVPRRSSASPNEEA